MGKLKRLPWTVLILTTIFLTGCFSPKAVELTCNDTKDGDFAQFPSRYDASMPNFRFELDNESGLDLSVADNDQEYWLWGGQKDQDDGDTLRARWDNLTVKTVVGGTETICDYCGSRCNNLATPSFEFSKVTVSDSSDSGAAQTLDTLLSNEGCGSSVSTAFHPDRDAVLALSYTSESCAEVLTSNKVNIVHTGDQATVTYPLEVLSNTKFKLIVSNAERFSPRLRVSRVVLSKGRCDNNAGAGRHCRVSSGTIQKLYVVRPNTNATGNNASFGVRDSEDGSIDLTAASTNYLDVQAGMYPPVEVTPAYLHTADTLPVEWQLEVDPSTPVDGDSFVVTFTLIPNSLRLPQ